MYQYVSLIASSYRSHRLLADKENSGSYIRGLLSRADVAKSLPENKTWDL